MTAPLLAALPGNERLATDLATTLEFELGEVETREFPDGETYLRLPTAPDQRPMVLVCTLDRPNNKLLSLLFRIDASSPAKPSLRGKSPDSCQARSIG
jgi:ribose-phosphate pyrophosphokinase